MRPLPLPLHSAAPRRVCCIWLPHFGLHVASRLQTSLLGHELDDAALETHQLALYRPGTRYQELLECSTVLEKAGILPGLPLREAQSRLPDAAFLPCDDGVLDAMQRALEPVLDSLDSFSPIVEPPSRAQLGDGRAITYVDVTGLEALYGPEPSLAARLLEVVDVAASAGIAAGKFTAWVAASLAARVDPPLTVVPPGEDALFLAPLPLETLPLPLQARLALQRLGVRTLGAFAALPANSVALRLSRYGEDGLRAHRIAQGLDDATLRPRVPKPTARVELTFEWEESDLDRLTFALKMLADQLATRLAGLDPAAEPADSDAERAASTDGVDSDGAVFWPDGPQLAPDDPDVDENPESDKRNALYQEKTPVQRGHKLPQIATFRPEIAKFGHAADTLRVTWYLVNGETHAADLRLAEPATSAAAFAEHLRWHVEGLDRLLAGADPPAPEAPPLGTEPPDPGGPTYERFDPGVAVTGITVEALGLQLPSGTQLKLLAAPVRHPGVPRAPDAHLDPLTRSRYARRAIARLQARWGPDAVRRAVLTTQRLPEHAFALAEPTISLQIDSAAVASVPQSAASDSFAPLVAPPPFWLLDPPEPAAILTPRKGGRRVLSLPHRRTRSRIVQSGGPWKLVDPAALTDRSPLRRDYYQIETEDGRACLVFWDRDANAWFLQGVFD